VSFTTHPHHNTHDNLACAFHGLHPVLIPYSSSNESFVQHLGRAQPDVLIAEAGTLQLHPVLAECQNLKQVIWVTKAGNKHMDFTETPQDVGGKVKISTWRDLIEEHKSLVNSEISPVEKGSPGPKISIIESSGASTTMAEYTSEVSHSL
jgi:acyl-CoA synthetase (AMP-forming)/AMP-acid ligase II